MSSITEQISATSKSQFESQLNFLNDVLKKTVDTTGQLVALNITTARNAAERSADAARQLIEAKDARAVLELARPLSAIEGIFAYGRELFTIASKTQVELLRTASDQFRDVPGAALALTAPVARATEQASEQVTHAATAATNAAVEATRAAAEGATDAAAQAARTAADAAQATTAQAVRTAADVGHTASAAADSAQPVVAAAQDAVQTTVQGAEESVTRAVEQSAEAVADSAPTVAAAGLFDGDTAAAPKTVRGKPATKPVAEAVAALTDKPSAALKNVPGTKPRK